MCYSFAVDVVAGAIADSVRRTILQLLAERQRSAGELASQFSISRPAVSRHLRVLREAGLVHDELVGRQRMYRLDRAPLTDLAGWLAELAAPESSTWSQRLDALSTEVARTRRERTQGEPTRTAPPTTSQEEIA